MVYMCGLGAEGQQSVVGLKRVSKIESIWGPQGGIYLKVKKGDRE